MADTEKYLAALVLFEIARTETTNIGTDSLTLLARAGFSRSEIGRLLAKSPNAVKKALHRSKKRRNPGSKK